MATLSRYRTRPHHGIPRIEQWLLHVSVQSIVLIVVLLRMI